jgi:hypothetical protein
MAALMVRLLLSFLICCMLLPLACNPGTGSTADSQREEPSKPFLSRFHWGVVFTPGLRPFEEQLADMKALGTDTAKFWLDWSAIQAQPLYYNPQTRMISKDKAPGFRWILEQDLENDPGLIREYAFPEKPESRFSQQVDWTVSDGMIFPLHAAGISAIPLLGDATTAPFILEENGLSLRMAPEPEGWEEVRCTEKVCSGYRGVGKDAYLGQIALHAAGAARRYKGTVPLWNTENELNWTPIHVLVAGWRMGLAWFDFNFLGRLIQTLHRAVHLGAEEEALTTMNLNIHDPFWLRRLRQWEPFMDIVGLGAYPNYLFSQPVLDQLLLDAIQRAALATVKPVMVMETGYPSGPAQRGYTEALQVSYLEQTAAGTAGSGASGYFWYRLDDPEKPPQADGLQAVEAFWGFVDNKGMRKESFFRFQDIQ